MFAARGKGREEAGALLICEEMHVDMKDSHFLPIEAH
jgi:hypothetical protein